MSKEYVFTDEELETYVNKCLELAFFRLSVRGWITDPQFSRLVLELNYPKETPHV